MKKSVSTFLYYAFAEMLLNLFHLTTSLNSFDEQVWIVEG